MLTEVERMRLRIRAVRVVLTENGLSNREVDRLIFQRRAIERSRPDGRYLRFRIVEDDGWTPEPPEAA